MERTGTNHGTDWADASCLASMVVEGCLFGAHVYLVYTICGSIGTALGAGLKIASDCREGVERFVGFCFLPGCEALSSRVVPEARFLVGVLVQYIHKRLHLIANVTFVPVVTLRLDH